MKSTERKFQCTAKTQTGRPCARPALEDGGICPGHAGKKHGPAKGSGGRPPITWDEKEWRIFDAMCSCGAPEQEIANALGVGRDVVNDICKRDRGMLFKEYREEKKSKGRVFLAAKQLEIAMGGSIPMLIWLGKQLLGQKEPTQTNKHIGADGGAVESCITVRFVGDKKTGDEK